MHLIASAFVYRALICSSSDSDRGEDKHPQGPPVSQCIRVSDYNNMKVGEISTQALPVPNISQEIGSITCFVHNLVLATIHLQKKKKKNRLAKMM